MKLYVGSAYYDRAARRNGWGDFFGAGLGHQGELREFWIAVFGRTFWFGINLNTE